MEGVDNIVIHKICEGQSDFLFPGLYSIGDTIAAATVALTENLSKVYSELTGEEVLANQGSGNSTPQELDTEPDSNESNLPPQRFHVRAQSCVARRHHLKALLD